MNPLPPNVDELISAYLDGEATADEIVVVESNTELMSRVDELRAISASVAAPIEAPAELKESHIAAALGVFDELFAATSTEADASPVAATVALQHPSRSDDDTAGTSSVVSFEAARERRSRRFNTGVMAATAAAMVLVVALAALSFGRSSQSDDVATAGAESFEASPADASADDDGEASSSAMAAPESADDGDAASELEASRSAAPPAPAFDAPQSEPMDDSATDDSEMDGSAADETAMDDSAMDTAEESGESDAASGAPALMAEDPDAAPFAFDIVLGTFADEAELRDELEQTTAEDLRPRIDAFEPGLFPSCQQAVPDLAAIDSVTFVGQAFVADRLVELHALSTDADEVSDEVSFVVVDPADDCSIVLTTQ